MKKNNNLSKDEVLRFLEKLENRFNKFKKRHSNILWDNVKKKLEDKPEKLYVLFKMEESGGEPDVVDYDSKKDEYIFFDCSSESPAGRRSLCYDRDAWESRKANKPESNALEMADELGIEILDEEQYKFMQTKGSFDTKTSSWIKTPDNIRKLGGALFCDRRYEQVFVYHNGAESYYAARGFRGFIKV